MPCVWCAAALFAISSSAYALTIVRDGQSDYTIVIPDESIPSERTAAKELADHLEQMSGAKLPMTRSSSGGRPGVASRVGAAGGVAKLAGTAGGASLVARSRERT